MVSLAGILQSFGKSEDILKRLAGLNVNHESVRTLTEKQGEQLEQQHGSLTPVESFDAEKPWDFSLPERDGVSVPGTVAYVGMDAFAVPIIDGDGNRDWKMMYVGLLYNPKKEHTLYLTGTTIGRWRTRCELMRSISSWGRRIA